MPAKCIINGHLYVSDGVAWKRTELAAGETIVDGKLYGWTGHACPNCDGTGKELTSAVGLRCVACAGTGDQHGELDMAPSDGEMYAAHSRSLMTPAQNAALDLYHMKRSHRAADIITNVIFASFGVAVVALLVLELIKSW